jgi:hypothetical protein
MKTMLTIETDKSTLYVDYDAIAAVIIPKTDVPLGEDEVEVTVGEGFPQDPPTDADGNYIEPLPADPNPDDCKILLTSGSELRYIRRDTALKLLDTLKS